MADLAAKSLDNVGIAHGDGYRQAFGRATLSSGTVEVDTGLNEVHAFVCTSNNNGIVDDDHAILHASEEFELTSGTVTVVGLDNAGSVSGDTEFSWFAIGR
jgi:hypothetical protein